jgi:hypothetical protein
LSCLQQMAFHTRIGRSLLTAENWTCQFLQISDEWQEWED